MATFLMPLPAQDFDPTEVAVPWQVLTGLGHTVLFATPDGRPGKADGIMLDGIGLDPWSRVPWLRRVRLLGMILRAGKEARRAYRALTADPGFRASLRWVDATTADADALILPGGHRARGMRAYLESAVLQRLTADFVAAGKPVGAICHGVLLAARSLDDEGRSVLAGRHVTALTWRQERAAAALARIGRWWDPDYYRTYREADDEPTGFMSVEQEVTRALGPTGRFVDVAADAPDARCKTSGLHRDTAGDHRAAWVVTDGPIVTARWPGDAHLFAITLARLTEPKRG